MLCFAVPYHIGYDRASDERVNPSLDSAWPNCEENHRLIFGFLLVSSKKVVGTISPRITAPTESSSRSKGNQTNPRLSKSLNFAKLNLKCESAGTAAPQHFPSRTGRLFV